MNLKEQLIRKDENKIIDVKKLVELDDAGDDFTR